MRSDVKLGFAIGGVLLAVLIVYVLVVPGGNTPRQTRIDKVTKPDIAKADAKVSLEPVASATQAYAPPAAPAGSFTPGALSAATQGNIPVPDEDGPVASNNNTNDAANVLPVNEPPPPAKAKDIDWAKLLNDQPVLMTTPASGEPANLAQGGEGKTIASQAPGAQPPGSVPPLEPERTTAHNDAPVTPPPVAADSTPPGPQQQPQFAQKTISPIAATAHVIQANETLSSISTVAYGNANYWPAIVKANPGIDPNRLKVGTTINLPALKDVKPAEPQNAAARIGPAQADAPVDATKQYRVQPGDSLHKISVTLYGKSTFADRIYELNKEAIGVDPARVKVGQVLQLPEPPTIKAAR